MKSLRLTFLILAALLAIMGTPIWAAGFIFIDPVVPNRTLPQSPASHPPTFSPPGRPLLKGTVVKGIHLQSESVTVNIKDQVARTHISQLFANDTDSVLAGTYLFPLPDDAAFSSFTLHIDGKPVEGKILAAADARRQYEAIVARMVDPGLLEYADYKTVRARIFPIPPRGTKKVELEYTQILKAENGMLKYRFPLRAQAGDSAIDDVKIKVKLASQKGLATIWSPSHIIKSRKESATTATAEYAAENTSPERDFHLYYSLSARDLAANLIAQRTGPEDGFFLLALAPALGKAQGIAKEIVVVADTSGSVQGEKIIEIKRALKHFVGTLVPGDRFNVVEFNTDVEKFAEALEPATQANKEAACRYIDSLEARGGTNIEDALRTGSLLLSSKSDQPAFLVLITDGEPTVGEKDATKLARCLNSTRPIRLFNFGIGYEIDSKLLDRLARENRGSSDYIEPGENLELALSCLCERIAKPVLTDVRISYSGVQVKDVYPGTVNDIFAGSQALLVGRYTGSGPANVRIEGRVGAQGKTLNFPLTFPETGTDNSSLPRLWAMRRIAHLTELAEDRGRPQEMINEIVALSKRYGIISAYTSFLSTDPSEDNRVASTFQRLPASPPPLWSRSAAVRGSALRQPGANQSFDMRAEEKAQAGFRIGDRFRQESGAGSFSAYSYRAKSKDHESSSRKSLDERRSAVRQAKALRELQASTTVLANHREANGPVKFVLDKTFYLKAGIWVDSLFDSRKHGNQKTVRFASQEYFELARKHPDLSRYLSAGKNLIVVYKGCCYRIIAKTTQPS